MFSVKLRSTGKRIPYGNFTFNFEIMVTNTLLLSFVLSSTGESAFDL